MTVCFIWLEPVCTAKILVILRIGSYFHRGNDSFRFITYNHNFRNAILIMWESRIVLDILEGRLAHNTMGVN
jgi:hypothetical protein